MTDNNKSLGFIGLGNMGGAILSGFANSEYFHNSKVNLYGYDSFNAEEKTRLMGEHHGAFVFSEIEVAEKSDFLLLAVKPQSLDEVLNKIKPAINSDREKVIISICAGISVEFIRKRLSPETKVIRVMPNMPMTLGLGASAISFSENIDEEEKKFALAVIGSCSAVEEIPEDKMNEVICINASSPAFIYLFAKGFIDYASEVGIDGEVALRLFSQALIGSANMLNSGKDIDELIAQVTSKGGTTFAGLEQLRERDMLGAVKAACEACARRGRELGG